MVVGKMCPDLSPEYHFCGRQQRDFVAFAALFVMPSILPFSPAFVLIGIMMGVSVTIGNSLIGESFSRALNSHVESA